MEQAHSVRGAGSAGSACGSVTDHTNRQHRLTAYDNKSSVDPGLTTAVIMQPPMQGVSHRRTETDNPRLGQGLPPVAVCVQQ